MDARDPIDTPEPEEDRNLVATIRRRFSRGERAVLAVALGVGSLFTVSEVRGHIAERDAKQRLIAHHQLASSRLTAEQKAFTGRVTELTTALAAQVWPGDMVGPAAAKALEAPGVYLRVTQPRATSSDEIARASEQSAKDAFATCLMLGATPADESEASVCEPGTGCIGDRSGKLTNFRVVSRGLAPFSSDWDTRAAAVSGSLGIHLLDEDLATRVRDDLPRAQRAVDEAAYVLVVVDEVPADTKMEWYSTGLESVQAAPHPVRVGLFDAKSGAVLARLRIEANGRPAAAAFETRAVTRQVQGCTLGLDVAERLRHQ